MIDSRTSLLKYIKEDNGFKRPDGIRNRIIAFIADYPERKIKRYKYYLRKQEYFINTAKGSKVKGLLGMYYEGKKNRLGEQLGIEIGPNIFGEGLKIYHSGSIVVNSAVRAGAGCSLHGNNCIGNNGKTEKVPILGNRIDIGFGAVLIGDIIVADDVVIGANAVVNKSIEIPGSIVAGVPAKIVGFKELPV